MLKFKFNRRQSSRDANKVRAYMALNVPKD